MTVLRNILILYLRWIIIHLIYLLILGDYFSLNYPSSERNQCFVYGRSDGTICILPMAGPETFDRPRCFGIHDSTCGQINSIALSRCGKYLFTAGMDGNIFKLEYNSDGRQERAEKSKEERGKVDERTGVELVRFEDRSSEHDRRTNVAVM